MKAGVHTLTDKPTNHSVSSRPVIHIILLTVFAIGKYRRIEAVHNIIDYRGQNRVRQVEVDVLLRARQAKGCSIMSPGVGVDGYGQMEAQITRAALMT